MSEQEERRLAEAAWDELERQHEQARGELGWVDRDAGVIDGEIDMLALVKAILREQTRG